MSQIREYFTQRLKELDRLRDQLQSKKAGYPEGTLRVSKCRGNTQYYYRQDKGDRQGRYIRKEDKDLARRLAQKAYDESLIMNIEQEREAISMFLEVLPKESAEEMYNTLSPERQVLVSPIRESDEKFRKRWAESEYQRKGFSDDAPELFSARGERVRSKSEILIADYLYRNDIDYKYEYPVRLKGWGTVHPDFLILNLRLRKEMIWEHFGEMDDQEYARKAIRKIASYRSNGYYEGKNLILTFETADSPLNTRQIQDLIQQYCI